jgi:hypothetical protein
MPNTLAHLGIQSIATRGIIRNADIKWIAVGAVLPDVPWIIRRALIKLTPPIDPIDLNLYSAAQSSLVLCLILAGFLACFSQRPKRVFFILALNSFIHLLLDACQKKWGGGVNLAAPLSWTPLNFGYFWPESWPTHLLTLLGLVFMAAVWFRKDWGEVVDLCRPKGFPMIYAAVLLAGYFILPVVFMRQIEFANAFYLATLRKPCQGCPVALDRVLIRKENDTYILKTRSGLRFGIEGQAPNSGTTVSIKGKFSGPATIRIEKLYVHLGISRDIPTYVGLLFFVLIWLRSFWLLRKTA